MRVGAAILGAIAAAFVVAAAPETEPTYSFLTLLVPQGDAAAAPSRVTQGAWVSGILVTEQTARLTAPVAIGGQYPSIGADALLAMAHSEKPIACTVERLVKKGERPHLCFADRDGDGQLDSWFTFADEIVMFENVRKVPVKRMQPLPAPVGLIMVDAAALSGARTEVGFEIVPLAGRLELCRTYRGRNDNYCSHSGPALDKSGQWQAVALHGAEFRYRKVDKNYEVQTLRPMRTQRFR